MSSRTLHSAIQYEQLLAQIYAEISPGAFGAAWLDSLAQFLQLDSAMVIIENLGDRDILFASGVGVAHDGVELPPAPRASSMWELDPGRDLPSSKAIALDRGALKKDCRLHAYAQACLKPFNLASVLCINIEGLTDKRVCIRLARKENRQDFTDTELGLIEGLSQHIYRAFFLLAHPPFEQGNIAVSVTAIKALMDKMRMGAMVFDQNLSLVASNNAAFKLLRRISGLSLKNNRLHANESSQSQDVLRYLDDLLHSSRGMCGTRALTITQQGSSETLQLVGSEIFSERLPHTGPKLLAVFIGTRNELLNTDPALLMELFGLSRTEARVAASLATGASIDFTATLLCRSRNTIRSHARAIYEKTGVGGQAQLMALILSSPANFLSCNGQQSIE